ncbi:T9SS type B sorting domain-containing protein [Pontibacter rugosus]
MPKRLRLIFLLRSSLLLVLLMLLVGSYTEVQATHLKAGDIIAKKDTTANPNPRRFFFRMTIYTVHNAQADDQQILIYPGVPGVVINVDRKSEIQVNSETDQEIFEWEYTYPSDGQYTTYWIGENRDNGILNLAAPSQQFSFFIATTISINSLRTSLNSTPVLTVQPIDDAVIGQRFTHNPGAYDADGDSLVFRLIAPQYLQQPRNTITTVPGYTLPSNTFQCPTSDGSASSYFTLDPYTGQLEWNSPCEVGSYNIAYVVEEWRRGPNGQYSKIGEVIRDMRIQVEKSDNKPPILEPKDTCVVAGTVFRGLVRATDPDNDIINLTIVGGIVPPARLVNPGTLTNIVQSPGLTTGTFTWPTTCEDIQDRPHQVIFRAEDVRSTATERLADVQAWNIRVVGPPPVLNEPQISNSSVTLTWDQYTCPNASKIRIYRREGPSNYVPDNCQTGVPASTGYVMIGEVDAGEVTFFDDNGGAGLEAGVTYCYIIYATFPASGFGESLASNESCVVIDQDIPYLTNVTVDETDQTNGKITVKWTEPMEVENLTPPLEYRLYRKVGMGPGDGYTEVKRTQDMNDLSFVDTGLNTVDNAYRYKLEFYQAPTPGDAPTSLREDTEASSVYLTVTASDSDAKEFQLNWTYDVPWNNSTYNHHIYRRVGNDFVLIDSVTVTGNSGSYTDRGTFGGQELLRGEDYCYYVQTRGSYSIENLPNPLLNNSQRVCVTMPKLICPPTLSIDLLDCEQFNQNPTEPPYQNVLTWVPDISPDCTDEIDYYTLYFKPTLDGEFTRLDTTSATTYTHTGLQSFAGCYVVTATDINGRESVFSNEVCKDNCIAFMLPNIITPNGDNLNDVFRPKSSAFIRSMKFKVFNRWGVQVYEGNDTGINWPGTDKDGNRLSDGTYYYEAEVEFFTLDPSKARAKYKGWVEIVR